MTEPNEDVKIDDGWDTEDGADGGANGAEGAAISTDDTAAAGTNGNARGTSGAERKAKSDSPPVEADDRQSQALEFVMNVLDEMEMDCEVELRAPKQDDPLEIQLEISGRDSGRIIGKKGQVLGALQYLTNRVVNRPGLEKRYVTVDAEGYRSRRDDTLTTMARRLGTQAVTDGKIITF
ncbi:MAG TPA: KH domain-containing protein, partial [Polyangiaceae bacterium]